MDLRQLAALTAVADCGTFSAAADKLHTVQSNVSAHIARLERQLGATLVDRTAGRLTEEGEVVVARARRIAHELDALVADVHALRNQVTGDVRLGVIGTVARWLVLPLHAELRAVHPGIRLIVVDASTTSLAPQLLAGTLNLAVVNLPVTDPEVTVTPLFAEEMIAVVPAGHELCGRTELRLSDLDGIPVILPPTGTALRTELDQCAGEAGFELVAHAEIDGVRLITSLAFDGLGVAIVPSTAAPANRAADWRRIPIVGIPPRRVGLVQRRRGMLSAPARALIDVLVRVLAAEAPRHPGVFLPGRGDSAGAVPVPRGRP